MEYITGDIMDITDGVIVHQVNCDNIIGGGLSGKIIKKYPVVAEEYHIMMTGIRPEQAFGLHQIIAVTDKLVVVNLFSQLHHGNPKYTGKVYTDIVALVKGLRDICTEFQKHKKVYIPYGIGCGLGGERWERVEPLISDLPLIVVKLPE